MDYAEAAGRYGLAQFGATAAPDAAVRVLPAGATVETLDLADGPVVAEGSLVVRGDVCGATEGSAPLVVFGDLTVRSLRLGTAVVVVMGHVDASGLVDAGCGAGSLAIRGSLTAPMLVAEHKVRVAGDVSVPTIVQFGGLLAGGAITGRVLRTREFYARTSELIHSELLDEHGDLRMDQLADWVVAGRPVLIG